MTVSGRGRWSRRRPGRQQRLIDQVLDSFRHTLRDGERPVIVLFAFQDFSWMNSFSLLNLPYLGTLLAWTYGYRKRRAVILTDQRLLLGSAPIFRPGRGALRDSFSRDDIRVELFDPRMMATPELHLKVGDRPLRLDLISGEWAPEIVELERELKKREPSGT